MIPGDVMEPKEKLFWTSLEVGKLVSHFGVILSDCITPRGGAIETNPFIVGPMEVNWIPVFTLFSVPPRRRTVVSLAPHDVMQPERSHVIDQCFPRLQHRSRNGFHGGGIIRERQPDPLLRDGARRQIWI